MSEIEVLRFMTKLHAAVRRTWLKVIQAYMRIPAPIRKELLLAAREKNSIDKYRAAHEVERQAGLAYVRELGAQARRDLGLSEEER